MKTLTGAFLLMAALALMLSSIQAEPCCQGRVGDTNGEGGDEPTVGDVAYMIEALFIYAAPFDWYCLSEADINQSGGPYPGPSDLTIGDVSILIDYLFVTGPSLGLPDCIGNGYSVDGTSNLTCKSIGTTSLSSGGSTCVAYEYDLSGRLTINRVDAGFNCCPSGFGARVWLDDHALFIEETESLDMGGCACLCLFDFSYEIMLPPGEWHIVIYEPYLGDYSQDPPIDFTVDLSAPTSGEVCFERTDYPWYVPE